MEKPYVFISYSTKDQEKASRVHDFLTENGINAWIASKDIHGGEDFANEITNAVNGCDCFVFVMSQNSDDSPHCINELSLAFSGRKKIIPLKIQEFTLSKTSTYFLQRAQWINSVDNFELGLKEMLNQMGKEASEENFLDQEKIQFEKQEKNLIKRAYLFLEEGKFAEADKYAEKVLDLDMEYAEAYLIKTLVDFKLNKLEQLFTLKTPIESNANLNKALRFASEEYKNVLLSYVEKNKEFLENERKKGIYNLALSRIKQHPTEINYEKSIKDLKTIIDFKDSKEQIKRIERLLKDWKDREERKRKQKQEMLKKQREEELRRKENRKKILIVSVIVLCLVIISIIIICSINTAKKNEKYELAQEYYIGKNYEQAKVLFSQLGDFKDSSLMVKRATYTINGYYGELVKLDKLTEYTIPNGVKRIKDEMFRNCDSLTSIVIPNSVTSIGSSAFSGCTSLASIEIPYSVTSIGKSAFHSCSSLTNIEIPNSVTSIGDYAFYECSSLTSVVIPDGVTSIGNSAFNNCPIEKATIPAIACSYIKNSKLKEVKITSGDSISSSAFSYCDSLTSVVIGNSVTSIGDGAFSNCTSLTSIVIPDSVTSIGEEAFNNCPIEKATIPAIACSYIKNSKLKEVKITSGDTISYAAFSGCKNLTKVEIPNSVTSISYDAFYNCTSLQYNVEGNLKYLGNTTNPYLYLAGTTSDSITSATINSKCKFIGSSAFAGCRSLTSIVIPDSVTSIGDWAFEECTSLTSIVIPDSVTSICYRAFYGCNSLQTIEIPNSVTRIGGDAFSYCDSLTSIVIPDSVTSIGFDAFEYCHSLKIYCEAESKPDGWDRDWNSSKRPVVWGYKGN